MKRLIFTLAVLGVLITPEISEAQRYGGRSELRLRMYNNAVYTVVFDRKIYNLPSNVFSVSGIMGGSHRLIVKQRVGGRYGAFRIIYNGNINIPAHSVVRARINRYNHLVIKSVMPNNGGGYDDGYYDDGGYYNKPMLNLPSLQNAMRKASFESDKKIIAEQAISTHRVKANQIYRILTMFSFESTKLKVAKFAYRYCIDKQNYYLVNNAFSFSSSIRELNNYISRSGGAYDNWNYYRRDYDDSPRYNDDW